METDDTASMHTTIALPKGSYTIVAVDPESGWTQEFSVQHETAEVHVLIFQAPKQKVMVRVLDPYGRPYSGALKFTTRQFLRYGSRRETMVTMIPELSNGFPILPRVAYEGGPGEAWTRATGPDFAVSRKRGATVHLEVRAGKNLSWTGWLSSLLGEETCIIRLRPTSVARFEVFEGDTHAPQDSTLKALIANTTHPDWDGRVDASGRVSLRHFTRLFSATFLLYGPHDDTTGVPLAFLILRDDARLRSETRSLMLQSAGAALRFPPYERVDWKLSLPHALRDHTKLIVSLRILARSWLPIAQCELNTGSSQIRLPSWVADRENVKLTLGGCLDCVEVVPHPARRELSVKGLESVRLMVSGPGGVALSGAGIRWVARGEMVFGQHALVTGIDGLATLWLPKSAAGSLLVECPGYASRLLPLDPATVIGGSMSVKLDPCSTLHVALRTGLSLKGARIRLVKFVQSGAPGDRIEFPVRTDGRKSIPLSSGAGKYSASVTLPAEGLTISRSFNLAGANPRMEWTLPDLEQSLMTVRDDHGDGGLCLLGSFGGEAGDVVKFNSYERANTCRVRVPKNGGWIHLELVQPNRPVSGPFVAGVQVWKWDGPASALPSTVHPQNTSGRFVELVGTDEDRSIALSDRTGWRKVVVVPAGGEVRVELPPGNGSMKYIGPAGGISRVLSQQTAQVLCASLFNEYEVRFTKKLSGFCGGQTSCDIRFLSPDAYHWRQPESGSAKIYGPEYAVGWGNIRCSDGTEAPFRTHMDGSILWLDLAMQREAK